MAASLLQASRRPLAGAAASRSPAAAHTRQAFRACSKSPTALRRSCTSLSTRYRSHGGSCAAAGGAPDLPGPQQAAGGEWPSLDECMESANCEARMIDGRPYIPLAEAGRFFAAGLHADNVTSGAVERLVLAEARAEELEEEREALQRQLAVLQGAAQLEREVHEREMRHLFEYAMALETEVEAAERDMRAVLVEAVHQAEGRVAAQYQAALAEAAAEVEEELAIERSMAEQLAELEGALHCQRESQHAWRDRALQAEHQFDQLKEMIGWRLQQAADAARRPAAEQEQAQAAERAAGQLRREQLAAEARELGPSDRRGPAEGGKSGGAGQEGKEPSQQARVVPPLNARMIAPGEED